MVWYKMEILLYFVDSGYTSFYWVGDSGGGAGNPTFIQHSLEVPAVYVASIAVPGNEHFHQEAGTGPLCVFRSPFTPPGISADMEEAADCEISASC